MRRRVPFFDPFKLYFGFGLGFGGASATTTNNIDTGSASKVDLALQTGLRLAYPLTRAVEISVGYRYVWLGDLRITLLDTNGNPNGFLLLDMDSHAFTTELRWEFYWLPFPSGRADRTFLR
jgi:opacity protein-like surface antigen